jgi:single-strand DNA-binding protein
VTIVASVHGRAARDGELRQSPAGKPWCRVSVACEAGQDRESREALIQWLNVVAFGRVAEELAKVEKGQTLSAIGRVELNRWTTQAGEQREGLQLIADSVLTARSARPGGRKRRADHDGQPGCNVPFNDEISF